MEEEGDIDIEKEDMIEKIKKINKSLILTSWVEIRSFVLEDGIT